VLDDSQPLSHRQAAKVALITHLENSLESLVRRVLLILDFFLLDELCLLYIHYIHMFLRHMTPIDHLGLIVMLLIAMDFCKKLSDEWWLK